MTIKQKGNYHSTCKNVLQKEYRFYYDYLKKFWKAELLMSTQKPNAKLLYAKLSTPLIYELEYHIYVQKRKTGFCRYKKDIALDWDLDSSMQRVFYNGRICKSFGIIFI